MTIAYISYKDDKKYICKRVIEDILKCSPSCVIIGTQGGLFLHGVYSKRRMDANN